MTALTRVVVAAGLLAAAGCSPSVADVAGTVTFEGKPVVYGTVVLLGPDGLARSGTIQPDGGYAVPAVPVGRSRVVVTSPRPDDGRPSPGAREEKPLVTDRGSDPGPVVPPEIRKGWVALPPRYADPDTSGLVLDVKPNQPHDLALTK